MEARHLAGLLLFCACEPSACDNAPRAREPVVQDATGTLHAAPRLSREKGNAVPTQPAAVTGAERPAPVSLPAAPPNAEPEGSPAQGITKDEWIDRARAIAEQRAEQEELARAQQKAEVTPTSPTGAPEAVPVVDPEADARAQQELLASEQKQQAEARAAEELARKQQQEAEARQKEQALAQAREQEMRAVEALHKQYGLGERSTGAGIGPGSTGTGSGRGSTGEGIGATSTGTGSGRGSTGTGSGPGSTGLSSGRGSTGFGIGRGDTGFGSGQNDSMTRWSTGFGIGPGSTGTGIGRGSTGFGSDSRSAEREPQPSPEQAQPKSP